MMLLTTPPAGKTADGGIAEQRGRRAVRRAAFIRSIMIEQRHCDPNRVIERGMFLGE
jgi:hypothetical protein